jgi:hypothetical protein
MTFNWVSALAGLFCLFGLLAFIGMLMALTESRWGWCAACFAFVVAFVVILFGFGGA